MLPALGAAAAVSALLAIVADWNETKPRIFLLLKPLTTLLIIGIALLAPPGTYRDLILAGLILSLLGDVFLMFEGNGPFMGGLSSFLIAHFLFGWTYLHGVDIESVPLWAGVFVLYGLAFSFVLLPRAGSLAIPVLVYGAALMGMAITASIRYVNVDDASGILVLIGASLFVLSDSALGARKFLGRYTGAQGVILSTYWSAIGLMALSAHASA
ncbi:MAG: lysoplasmalogenase [Nevskiales bacterium]|nr:lysoplasmalogenase [Nevskiales bacterium]